MPEAKHGRIKITAIITLTSAIISIVIYFTGKSTLLGWFRPDASPPSVINNITTNNTTTITPKESPGASSKNVTKPSPGIPNPGPPSSPVAKRAFLGLQITGTGGQWDNNLTDSIDAVFAGKGYNAIEAGSGSKQYSFDNIVSCNLTTGTPEEEAGAFNTVIINYKFVLTLRFYKGNDTQPCTQRIFQATVSKSKQDKDGIVRQAVADLTAQLKSVNAFPFCIKKP